MANITITFKVNTTMLQSECRNNPPTYQPKDNKWATLEQEGGTLYAPPGGDAANYKSEISEGDTILWQGALDPSVVIQPGDPVPIINITQIQWSSQIPSDVFGEPVLGQQANGGGSTVTVRANKNLDDYQSYTIQFYISYKGEFLDPKIKVIKPKP